MASSVTQRLLLLAETVADSAAGHFVTDILEHPDIYNFDEFLHLESFVNSLKQHHSLALSTLELFAYGTISDYESQCARFIPLTALARRKLQLLTLASLAVHTRILPYELLLKQLQIESIRELEDLIIDGIYAQVIRGKLDQLNSHLNVEYAISRDVNSIAFDRIEDILDKWCLNCTVLLNVLKHEAKTANEKKKIALIEQDKYDKEMLSMMKIVDLHGQNSSGSSKRDNDNNNSDINLPENHSNILIGNEDLKQAGTKKSIRNAAKRILQP